MKRYTNIIGVVIAWLLIFAIFSILVPKSFPTFENFETLMRQVVIVGFGSIGMTYIIIAGGIDLSAGSLVALVTVVIALVLQKGFNPVVAALAGVATGFAGGLVNGAVITRLRAGAFIVTLATMDAFRGIAKGLAHQNEVVAPGSWLGKLTEALHKGQRWILLPVGAWAMIACAVFAAWALRFTVFGRQVVAIGSNPQAAKLSGVRVNRVTTWVYIIGGIAIGLAGLMQYSRLELGDPTVAVGLELDIIAAVVIGGGSLSGGEGNVFASLVGALIMETIRAGGAQMGMQDWVQNTVTGVIILVAVALDRWRIARANAT